MSLRVLVVDDSLCMRKVISKTLEQLGITNIETSGSPRDALNTITGDFDLILTDYNMPDINGMEFVQLLRNKEKTKNVPIIMITTESGKNLVMKAIKEGINDYIVKPFQAEQLRAKIEKILPGRLD